MNYNNELCEISVNTILLRKKILNEIETLKEEILDLFIEGFKREYENKELEGLLAFSSNDFSLKFTVDDPDFMKINKLVDLGLFDDFASEYCFSLEKKEKPIIHYVVTWDYNNYLKEIYSQNSKVMKKIN